MYSSGQLSPEEGSVFEVRFVSHTPAGSGDHPCHRDDLCAASEL